MQYIAWGWGLLCEPVVLAVTPTSHTPQPRPLGIEASCQPEACSFTPAPPCAARP